MNIKNIYISAVRIFDRIIPIIDGGNKDTTRNKNNFYLRPSIKRIKGWYKIKIGCIINKFCLL